MFHASLFLPTFKGCHLRGILQGFLGERLNTSTYLEYFLGYNVLYTFSIYVIQ